MMALPFTWITLWAGEILNRSGGLISIRTDQTSGKVLFGVASMAVRWQLG
jgi:hypothetical protein